MANETHSPTIESTIYDFLESQRNPATAAAYETGLGHFKNYIETDLEMSLQDSPAPFDHTLISGVIKYIRKLKDKGSDLAPATQHNYVTAIVQYLIHVNLYVDEVEINTDKLRTIVRKEGPKRVRGSNAIYVDIHAVHIILEYARGLDQKPVTGKKYAKRKRLANYRDRALILLMANSGARIDKEALQLNRGSINWDTGKAEVLGKGNKLGYLSLSAETLTAINEYLALRSPLDELSGKSISSLPLFARHDPKVSNNIVRLGYTSALRSLTRHFEEALREHNEELRLRGMVLVKVTPHYLRHYFVTNVMNATGGNLAIAQRAARHENLNTTRRYAHVDEDEVHDAVIRAADS
jgi:integrase/recombinase XerC/integrase/recombinase XerD